MQRTHAMAPPPATLPPSARRPTQLELAESARRRVANHAIAIAEMMVHPGRPTMAELAKLRARRPAVWNVFPENHCADCPGATV